MDGGSAPSVDLLSNSALDGGNFSADFGQEEDNNIIFSLSSSAAVLDQQPSASAASPISTEGPPLLLIGPSPSGGQQGPEIFVYGFVLVLIPTATILGNFLVILSVLRFKALHSAINFLILGLAVADLMVALFVMPYAVYVYLQGGNWLLGPLMCNLYLSSDVACSTASIILLALISFDRYKAISKPIQYSRQAQNICRVAKLFVGVWIYSFCVASPIVLGFNEPSEGDDSAFSPFECRFYNVYFSVLSSLVSFVLPCCVVIFVYVRIIRALRRREMAAKLRKAQQHLAAQQAGDGGGTMPANADCEEAGEIVAGPAVNMMMIALPSLNRQIKRYERHKRALEEAEVVLDDEMSSSESLSEDGHILTNDFLSEVPTSNSKTSATLEPHRGSFLIGRFRASFSGVMEPRKKSSLQADDVVPSIFQKRKKSACDPGGPISPLIAERRKSGGGLTPADHRHLPMRSKSNREECRREEDRQRSRLLPLNEEEKQSSRADSRQLPAETCPPPKVAPAKTKALKAHQPARGALSFPLVRRLTLGREIRVNHYLLTGGGDQSAAGSRRGSSKMRNGDAQRGHPPNGPIKENGALGVPVVSVAFKVASLMPPLPFRRGSSAVELAAPSTHPPPPPRQSEVVQPVEQPKENGERTATTAQLAPNGQTMLAGTEQQEQTTMPVSSWEEMTRRPTGTEGDESGRQLLLQRTVTGSRKDRRASLRRKVHKVQRKEKRATKTLGIVVGTFLCCWVPFFSLNIMNALCMELRVQWCQVGFGPFFYTTWIGYANSLMNPVIYTIFNAEFRRAFKSLLMGRRAGGVRRI